MVNYNRELLDECLTRDCATLYGEYEKLNREAKIQFKCNCGNDGEKIFKTIYDRGGLYCKECTKINTSLKKESKTYNKKVLYEYLVRDCATLTGEYENCCFYTPYHFKMSIFFSIWNRNRRLLRFATQNRLSEPQL